MGLIDFEFFAKILPSLLKASVVTISLTAMSLFFGTIIGLVVALMKISRFKILAVIGGFYTWVIRGIPLLVQLFVLYFGLPKIGIQLASFQAAVIGVSVCGGAYIAEIIRAGIQSIDRGQMEAALSLGMPYLTAMRRIIIPQAYRRLLPPLGNEFITLMKDTSLVSAISMTELSRQGTILDATFFRSLEIYLCVGVIYLMMTTVFVAIFGQMEKRLALKES